LLKNSNFTINSIERKTLLNLLCFNNSNINNIRIISEVINSLSIISKQNIFKNFQDIKILLNIIGFNGVEINSKKGKKNYVLSTGCSGEFLYRIIPFFTILNSVSDIKELLDIFCFDKKYIFDIQTLTLFFDILTIQYHNNKFKNYKFEDFKKLKKFLEVLGFSKDVKIEENSIILMTEIIKNLLFLYSNIFKNFEEIQGFLRKIKCNVKTEDPQYLNDINELLSIEDNSEESEEEKYSNFFINFKKRLGSIKHFNKKMK
jgi:NurA-like 5'-3' nuclease